MNAQQIINESKYSEVDHLALFYPELWAAKKADENITKICKNLN